MHQVNFKVANTELSYYVSSTSLLSNTAAPGALLNQHRSQSLFSSKSSQTGYDEVQGNYGANTTNGDGVALFFSIFARHLQTACISAPKPQ